MENLDKLFQAFNVTNKNRNKLQFRFSHFFGGIDFKGKKVLDIGGGSGLFSFFSSISGAKEVICLEPEFAGSTPGMKDNFERIKSDLDLANVELKNQTFQDFECSKNYFDIIIMHNSINHLEEKACITLQYNDKSKEIYEELFRKMYSICKAGAVLVAADCTNKNFYNLLGIKNPFMPTIEWNKHQSPKTWCKMLIGAGFGSPIIKWTTPNRLGYFGKILMGNFLVSYFTLSHFCLRVCKK